MGLFIEQVIAQTNIMKKAIINNYCNGIQYIKGNLYTEKEVAHLDPNDFETVTEEVIEKKPKAMTTKSLKPKKK